MGALAMYISIDLKTDAAASVPTRLCQTMGKLLALSVAAPLALMSLQAGADSDARYGFGVTPTAEEIAEIDIDVMPDGRGLPDASGDHAQGQTVYETQCLACHGADLGGVKETGGAALIGGRDSLASGTPKKTIESYWPYASTVFDYVKRAMPFNAPGSLTDDEVYSVVAYILAEANIIDKTATLDATTLPQVEMPNKDGFIADPRPDIFNYD